MCLISQQYCQGIWFFFQQYLMYKMHLDWNKIKFELSFTPCWFLNPYHNKLILNGIIHPTFLALSIIIFRDIKMKT